MTQSQNRVNTLEIHSKFVVTVTMISDLHLLKIMFFRTKEMAQYLALAVLSEAGVQFPAPTWHLMAVTPVPGNPVPSSGPLRH